MYGKRYLVILFFAGSLFLTDSQQAFGAWCEANYPALGRWELIHILRDGSFSGVLDEYVDLRRIGNIRFKDDTCFTLFLYSRSAASSPGTNVQGAMRLLVIRNYEYIGMYALDDPPVRIRENKLEFKAPKDWGNVIEFTKNGPPEKIHLQGEFRTLFK